MNNIKKSLTDSLILGSALFSMFFGAGNMIFPPFLGLESGVEWFTGFLCYFIFDIGLAVITVFSLIRTGGFDGVLKPLGKKVSTAAMSIIILLLGPFVCIPRTAATTYELSLLPLWENANIYLFYVAFFLVVLLLCLKESAVVDIVGKILTPVLFVGLLVFIVKGVISPLGEISTVIKTDSVPLAGIEAGYQSLDVLAAAVFGILILNSAIERGHTSYKAKALVTGGAAIVAGSGIFIIYLGLTYLGATVSEIYTMHTSRTELLSGIISRLFSGGTGQIFFAVVAAFACLSTAIAITSAAAKYFSLLTKNRLGYKTLVVLICILSYALSLFGVDNIVRFASPVLNTVYPPTLALIAMSFFDKYLNPLSYKLASLTAFFIALSDVFRFEWVNVLPFSVIGSGWLLPSFIAAIVGILINKMHQCSD